MGVAMTTHSARPLTMTLMVAALDLDTPLPDYARLLGALRGPHLGLVMRRDGVPSVRFSRGHDASEYGLSEESRRFSALEIEFAVVDGPPIEQQIESVHDELKPLGLGVVDVLMRGGERVMAPCKGPTRGEAEARLDRATLRSPRRPGGARRGDRRRPPGKPGEGGDRGGAGPLR